MGRLSELWIQNRSRVSGSLGDDGRRGFTHLPISGGGGQQGKGTDRRANRLQGEYEAALRAYDVRYHGAQPLRQGQPEPPPGPLVRRLRSFGPLLTLVAGPWGDLSQDLHRLLRIFAEARVANRARAEGWGGVGAEDMGQAMGQVRRATSVVVVRLQALCLQERLAHLGPGARAAGERRRVVKQLEERRRREAQAYRLAHLKRVGPLCPKV